MTDKLTLAVNHALNDSRFVCASAMAFNLGIRLNAKHERTWCEYGFKDELIFNDLHNDRVLTIGDMSDDAIGFLDSGYKPASALRRSNVDWRIIPEERSSSVEH